MLTLRYSGNKQSRDVKERKEENTQSANRKLPLAASTRMSSDTHTHTGARRYTKMYRTDTHEGLVTGSQIRVSDETQGNSKHSGGI